MKLTIASNGRIHKVDVTPRETINENGEVVKSDGVHSIVIDFDPSTFFSDFELWLDDDEGNHIDYKKICLSRKKQKMQMFR